MTITKIVIRWQRENSPISVQALLSRSVDLSAMKKISLMQ